MEVVIGEPMGPLITTQVFTLGHVMKAPLGALQIGDLIVKAGFPPGVINILNGDGNTGALLASHMDIDRLSFTGSVETGKKIQIAATQSNLKRVTLELGGKSPSIIFDDADLDNALLHSSQSFLVHSGQICVAASRVLVHKSIVDRFISELKVRFEALAGASGTPSLLSSSLCTLGPNDDHAQANVCMRVDDARSLPSDVRG